MLFIFIGKWFPLISSSDIFSINTLTMILKIIGSHDIKHIMTLLITTITSVLNVSTNIITSITGRLIRLAVIVVMSALAFITAIIRYISVFALIFSTTCRKAKFRKKYLFIQTNSFITFTCPRLQASGLAQRLIYTDVYCNLKLIYTNFILPIYRY
jgi:hypothetical protein